MQPDTDLFAVFQARDIATPLEHAHTVDVRTSKDAALATLDECKFDQAPVTKGGKIFGWLATEALRKSDNLGAGARTGDMFG